VDRVARMTGSRTLLAILFCLFPTSRGFLPRNWKQTLLGDAGGPAELELTLRPDDHHDDAKNDIAALAASTDARHVDLVAEIEAEMRRALNLEKLRLRRIVADTIAPIQAHSLSFGCV
jgi:hypothetical protein